MTEHVHGSDPDRGEHLNARQVERRRRTGWRLQDDDITRLERELGIGGDA